MAKYLALWDHSNQNLKIKANTPECTTAQSPFTLENWLTMFALAANKQKDNSIEAAEA